MKYKYRVVKIGSRYFPQKKFLFFFWKNFGFFRKGKFKNVYFLKKKEAFNFLEERSKK